MSEIDWKRVLALLIQFDLRGWENLARGAPGTLVVPGLLGLTLAVPIVALFATLAMGGVGDVAMTLLAAVLGFATLASFGPPRWPGVALSMFHHLPVGERAVYAHSIVRFLYGIPATAAYGLLPLVLTIGFLAPGFSERVISVTMPVALAMATAASMGRMGWGLVAASSPRVQLAARLALGSALSLPATTFLAGAPGDLTRSLFGPWWALAWLGLSGVPLTTTITFEAVLLMAAACVTMALAPVRVMPAHPTPIGFALRLVQADGTTRSGPVPRASPFLRRPHAPYAMPPGAEQALRFLARQWLKVFLWIPLVFLLIGGLFLLVRLAGDVFAWQIEGPRLDPVQLSSGLYLALLWAFAAASFPGYLEGRRAGAWKADADRAALPAALRIGPTLLSLKRWPYLQTLPFDKKAMERAFLRPLLVLLLLCCAGWAAFTTAGSPRGWISWFAIVYPVGTLLIWVGGFSIGRRSAKRHAAKYDSGLEALHTIFAGLLLASGIPLALVGPTGIQAVIAPWWNPGLDGLLAFYVFEAASIALPAGAYLAARGRLVAATRSWESPFRVAALAAGALVFFVVPIALIASWLSPVF